MKKPKPFDRYDYYHRAVQSPDVDCEIMAKIYRELRGKRATHLREDFCAAFANCCAWVKRGPLNRAYGVDLDSEPLAYGRQHYLATLRADQQRRVKIFVGSVLTTHIPAVDVIAALNFSFYIFKSRLLLRQYFKRAHAGLRRDGLLMLDCFGGRDVQEANIEKTKVGSFTYFWEQENFEPLTNEAMFHIHFKRKGEKIRKRVFSYDWRVWTIAELRELLAEAGFSRSHVYWEGTNRHGFGDGKFKRVEKGEECLGWVAYVVAEK